AITAGQVAVKAYEIAKTAKEVAGSAATAATLGFHLDTSLTHERETKSSTQEQTKELGSHLQATDMEITADKDIAAKGVDLIADGGDLHLKAGNGVHIESSEDTLGTKSDQEKMSIKVK